MNRILGTSLIAVVCALAVAGCAAVAGAGNGISALGDSITSASNAARDGRDRPLAYDPASCLPDGGKQPTAFCKGQHPAKAKAIRTASAKARPAKAKATPAKTASAKPVPAKAQAAAARPAAVTQAKATPAKATAKPKARRTAKVTKASAKPNEIGTKTQLKTKPIGYDPAACLPDADGKQPTALCRDQKPEK